MVCSYIVINVDITASPLLLKLSLSALAQSSSKLTPDQRSLLAATFLSTLDAFSIPSPPSADQDTPSVIYLSTRHLHKLCGLLDTLLDNPPPTSDALSTTLTTIAVTCISFLDFADLNITTLAWTALASIMKSDFDVILGLMGQLRPRLPLASLDFLEVVVSTNFKIRNGVEFITEWTEILHNVDETTSLRHPKLVELYVFSKGIKWQNFT
jgi:hypothetical protein